MAEDGDSYTAEIFWSIGNPAVDRVMTRPSEQPGRVLSEYGTNSLTEAQRVDVRQFRDRASQEAWEVAVYLAAFDRREPDYYTLPRPPRGSPMKMMADTLTQAYEPHGPVAVATYQPLYHRLTHDPRENNLVSDLAAFTFKHGAEFTSPFGIMGSIAITDELYALNGGDKERVLSGKDQYYGRMQAISGLLALGIAPFAGGAAATRAEKFAAGTGEFQSNAGWNYDPFLKPVGRQAPTALPGGRYTPHPLLEKIAEGYAPAPNTPNKPLPPLSSNGTVGGKYGDPVPSVAATTRERVLGGIAGQIDTLSRLEAGQARNLQGIRNVINKLEAEQGGLARHLDDVRRERMGEVVSTKTRGDAHSHITEVRQARDALQTRVDRLRESLKARNQHDPAVYKYVEEQIRQTEDVIRRVNDALGR